MVALFLVLAPQAPLPADAAPLNLRYSKQEVMVPMRDGKRLHTTIYAPRAGGPYPFVITRTPYGSQPYGEDRFPGRLGPSEAFEKEGFIFVTQDVRGRYMSEDDHVFSPPHKPVKGPRDHDESTDAYDTLEWLLKNVPNHNGKAGVIGISQPGFYASNALIDAHPALVCGSPQAPVTDRFKGDDDHHNGAFFLAQRFRFLAGFGAPRPQPATQYPAPPTPRVIPDLYRFFLDVGALPNIDRRFFKGTNRFWKESMSHGTYDAYWKPRGMEQHLRDIRPATLVVGGWYDAEDLFGPLKTYRAIETQSAGGPAKLVMGPWSHGQWAGNGERLGDFTWGQNTSAWFRDNVQFPFFMHHLKGAPAPDLAEATVFLTGANEWRRFDAWPPREARRQTLHLAPGGRLGWTPAATGSVSWLSDPNRPVPFTAGTVGGVPSSFMLEDQRFAWRRPDVVSFETAPLAADVTLAGPIQARLRVSTTGTDADFIVKVIDVFPDDAPSQMVGTTPVAFAGYQHLVRAEVMRAKFRDSLERPAPMPRNRPTSVNFELQDVFHRFRKGHRIMVQVQSSWFPLVDRNPQAFLDIYQASDGDFRAQTHTLILGGANGSRLEVGVLP